MTKKIGDSTLVIGKKAKVKKPVVMIGHISSERMKRKIGKLIPVAYVSPRRNSVKRLTVKED